MLNIWMEATLIDADRRSRVLQRHIPGLSPEEIAVVAGPEVLDGFALTSVQTEPGTVIFAVLNGSNIPFSAPNNFQHWTDMWRRSGERRVVGEAAERLAVARHFIHFGVRIEEAHRDARAALSLLAQLNDTSDDSAATELAGEACLIVAMCLRLRGKLHQAEKWLDRADMYFMTVGRSGSSLGWRSSLMSESLNTRSLIALNYAEASCGATDAMRASLIHRTNQQHQFVIANAVDLRPEGNQLSEALNRVADVLALTATPQTVLQYLEHVNFLRLSSDKSLHTQVLTVLFIARNYLLSGDFDSGWRYIELAATLPVVSESVFLQITLQERIALFHSARGDVANARVHQDQADQLRALERIHETRLEGEQI